MTKLRSLGSLETEARAGATARGHSLGHWDEDRDQPKRPSALAHCDTADCTAWVQVMVFPPANGIDIGGPAVAMNCPYAEERL